MSARKLISFGGCSFLGVYYAGVGKCVVDHAPHLFDDFDGFYGASAGAISAVVAACQSDPMVSYKWVKKTFEASRKYRVLGTLHPSFDLFPRLRRFLNDTLPKDAHKRCRGKVKISLTLFPSLKNWILSDFASRKELIDAVVASCSLPGYSGLTRLPKIRGKRCFDGGFSSNIPFANDPDVITVSPFSGGCDICPQGDSASPYVLHVVDQPFQISVKNAMRLGTALLPTSWAEMEDHFYQGYQDAHNFLTRDGLISHPIVRPLRRASCKEQLVTTATETTASDDETSDYYSLSGSSSVTSRSHSRSQSLCTEFLSCLGEEEGCAPSAPFPPTSLEEELEQMEVEDQLEQLELRRGSTEGLGPPPSSSSSWSWLLHSCSPLQLPLVHRVGRLVGMGRWQESASSAEPDSWHKQESGTPVGIAASWPSSMAVF